MLIAKVIIAVCSVFCFASVGAAAPAAVSGLLEDGRVYVFSQPAFESLGCQVIWDKQLQLLLIKNEKTRLTINIKTGEALINGQATPMPYKPRVDNQMVLTPLRFCAEALGMGVDWNSQTRQATIMRQGKDGPISLVITVTEKQAASQKTSPIHAATEPLYRSYSQKIAEHHVNIVEIPPGGLKAELGLAYDRVGAVEELSSIAARSNAVIAINGSYFAAYGGTPEPWNLLIKQGKVIHAGANGTAVGFTASGRIKMAAVKVKIEGANKGSYQWPNNWYAYGFNHTANGNSVYIYTPERGSKIGFSGGTAVTVTNGVVSQIAANDNALIPPNGFVAVFSGSERSLLERFTIGSTSSYRVVFEEIEESWTDVVTAVGAGPRLIRNGHISADPVAEGFTESKITQNSGARSAIGARRDGTVLLVTTPGATISQLAKIMHSVGAWNAMNLDGGASSGLWVDGQYVTEPGRELSNVLLFR